LLGPWAQRPRQAQPAAPARPHPTKPLGETANRHPAARSHRPRRLPSLSIVQIVLAVDASGSVDERSLQLQKQGYAKGVLNPRVLNAIRNGSDRAIAVFHGQWTGPTCTSIMVPWTGSGTQRSAQAVAR